MRLSSYIKLLDATNKQITEILAKNFIEKLKEAPMDFRERLARCLDRYRGSESSVRLLLVIGDSILRLNVDGPPGAYKQVASSMFLGGDDHRHNLDAILSQFEKWLDGREQSKPRIFTDESGKKYEIREVKE